VPKANALTDAGLKSLLLPESGTATVWDATVKGFGVRISPKGTKTFIALIGSGQRHKIGRYPLISLTEARSEAKKVLAQKTLGTFEKPHTITWETAVERYLAACADKNRPRTVADYKKHLARFPFKGRRLATIKKRDVAAELEKITAKSMRAHVLTSIKAFFSWCAGQGYVDQTPLAGLKAAAQRLSKPRRALSPEELKTVLSTALQYPYPFGQIIALLILTGQRRTEVSKLEWEWIADDTITIPASVAKNHLEHTFPYGKLVRQVLESIPAYAKQSRYLFPARYETMRGKSTTVFNAWSKSKAAFDKEFKGVEPYKLHDLRRSFATTLQSLSVPLEVREKLLNHISGSQAGIAGVYNVHPFREEMKDAIAKHDAFLISLLAQGQT
jgi:integrase